MMPFSLSTLFFYLRTKSEHSAKISRWAHNNDTAFLLLAYKSLIFNPISTTAGFYLHKENKFDFLISSRIKSCNIWDKILCL